MSQMNYKVKKEDSLAPHAYENWIWTQMKDRRFYGFFGESKPEPMLIYNNNVFLFTNATVCYCLAKLNSSHNVYV